jgi:hypothetical protein
MLKLFSDKHVDHYNRERSHMLGLLALVFLILAAICMFFAAYSFPGRPNWHLLSYFFLIAALTAHYAQSYG